MSYKTNNTDENVSQELIEAHRYRDTKVQSIYDSSATNEFIEQTCFTIGYDIVNSIKYKLRDYNKTTKMMLLDALRDKLVYEINELLKSVRV